MASSNALLSKNSPSWPPSFYPPCFQYLPYCIFMHLRGKISFLKNFWNLSAPTSPNNYHNYRHMIDIQQRLLNWKIVLTWTYLLENNFLKFKNVSDSQNWFPKFGIYIFIATGISLESNTYFDCLNFCQGCMVAGVQHCQLTGKELDFLNIGSLLGMVRNWREKHGDRIMFPIKKGTS